MRIKKLIKKFLLIISFSIVVLFGQYSTSNAAGELPSKAGDLYQWRNTAKFFDMDAVKLINKYRTGKSTLNPSGGESGRYICCGQASGGLGNIWHIQNVIDIDGEGNVTVYYYNSSKKTTVSVEVTDKTSKKWFNALGYCATHYGEKVPGASAWAGGWGVFSADFAMSIWHTMVADGILSKYHIEHWRIPNQTNQFGQEQEIRNYAKNVKIAKGKKIRIVATNITDGQRRLIAGIMKDDETKLVIEKRDASKTTKLLGGAKYNIYNEKGKLIGKNLKTATSGTNKGKIIVTDKKLSEKLVIGKTYTIEEISPPENYFLQKSEAGRKKTITLKKGKNTVTFKNYPKYGNIKVRKVDSITGKPLARAKFTCRNVQTGVTITKTTGADGILTFNKVKVGEAFEITEIRAPNGYEISFEPVTITIPYGETTYTIAAKDTPAPGNEPDEGMIKLIETTDVPLGGITFGLKYWIPDNPEYMKWKREPQTSDSKYWGNNTYWTGYWVDEDGVRHDTYDTRYEYKYPELYRADHQEWEVWKDNYDYYIKSQTEYVESAVSMDSGYVNFTGRSNGTYSIYEISSDNPYFDVDDSEPILTGYRIGDTGTLENKRTYVDIEGVVFEDEIQGKDSNGNNLYDDGEGINDIKVTLMRNGSAVSQIWSGIDSQGETLDDGYYKFWGDRNNLKIEYEHLSEYTIEFEYNGMKYKSIPVNLSDKGGSKAQDTAESRKRLTDTYKKITSKEPEIEYERPEDDPYTSHVVYTDEGEHYDTEQYGKNQYHVQGTTDEAGLDLASYYQSLGGQELDSITDVNFGIVLREQPDLALTKDLSLATVQINGYAQVYVYSNRSDYGEEPLEDVTVKFDESSDYANVSYSRRLFPEDILYNGPNPLSVTATYKIDIKNKASTLTSISEELVDYYSREYTFVGAGENIDRFGNITSSSSYPVEQQGEEHGYKKMLIKERIQIEAQTTKSFYIQYSINSDALLQLVQQNGTLNLENFIEINAYSTKEGEEDYAGIDKNSQPGNMIPNQVETYEDDTDKAPGLEIGLNPTRTVSGNVFEDLPLLGEEKNTGKERIGNGILDDGEQAIQNVTVELIPQTEGTDRQTIAPTLTYSRDAIGAEARTTVDENGNYTISGFVPNKYMVRFTWNNGEKYTVQRYKGTIYPDSTRQNNELWYLNSSPRYSDAMDDIDMRTAIDEETNVMTNKVLEAEKRNELNNKTLKAYTAGMNVYIEFGQTNVVDGAFNMRYDIQNVDYGIIERPRQELELRKRVSRMSLIGPDGVFLVDIKIDENGKVIDEVKNAQYMAPSAIDLVGIVKSEVDNEVKQNSTLVVKYEFIITNTGEKDYWNTDGSEQTYYLYGTGGDNNRNIIELKPNTMIDYLDNTVGKSVNTTLEEASNDIWEILNRPEQKEQLLTEGLLSQEVLNSVKDKVEQFGIFDFDQTSINGLVPIETRNITKTTFTTSRLLNTSSDEVDVSNIAELIKITKTAGAPLDKSTLGNLDKFEIINDNNEYDNEKVKLLEPDESVAEQIIIIPPTGDNRNYTMYIILGVTALVVIGAGVILIKKKIV